MVTHQPSTAAEPATAALFPRTYIGGHEVRWQYDADGFVRYPEFVCIAEIGADCRPKGCDCDDPACCEAISWLQVTDPEHAGLIWSRPFLDGEITIDIAHPGRVTWMHCDDWICQDCGIPMSLSDPAYCISCWQENELGDLGVGQQEPISGVRP